MKNITGITAKEIKTKYSTGKEKWERTENSSLIKVYGKPFVVQKNKIIELEQQLKECKMAMWSIIKASGGEVVVPAYFKKVVNSDNIIEIERLSERASILYKAI